MATELQMRMAEVERAHMGFMALKDQYDKAVADNEELKGLLEEFNADTVDELVVLLKSKNEALDFEMIMNSECLTEIEKLGGQLEDAKKKLSEADDAL